jgi:hypothetical protein
VSPVWPELILWQEAVDALFADAPPWLGDAQSEIPRRAIARERFCDRPMPLKRLYLLRPERLASPGDVENALIPYQPELAAALADPAALHRLSSAVAGRVQTLAFSQVDLSEMEDLADRIIADCGWSDG